MAAQVAERVDTLSPAFDAFRRDPAFNAGGLGQARSAAFERFQSIYSNVRARDDAENRAARTVADDLKTRVAIYLSNAA